MPPIIIAGAIAGAGALGGAAIASSGAKSAANAQSNAANYAADLNKQAADQALAENQRQFNVNQQNIAPWLQQGTGALANLSYLLGVPFYPQNTNTAVNNPPVSGSGDIAAMGNIPRGKDFYYDQRLGDQAPTIDGYTGQPVSMQQQGQSPASPQAGVPLSSLVNKDLGAYGSLMQPFQEKFQAPTNVTEQNDPGFQFRLQQGQLALERSAASRGNLLTGGTAKDINQFAQDYASNEYGNVYNRAFNEYATRYNQFQNNQANQYNRLASLSGVGQQSAAQLGYLGQNSANNSANILLGSANAIGNQMNNAAAARGTGYLNSGNIWGNTLSSLTNNPYLLNAIMSGGVPAAQGGTGSIPLSSLGGFGGINLNPSFGG